MAVLKVCLNDDIRAGPHRFEGGLFADRQTLAAEVSEVFGLMPESSLDKRIQTRIIPVETFDLAACRAQIQGGQVPARKVPGDVGRG
jgi:hypothetical protein